MTLFTNETFANDDVKVDGNQYESCTFDTVELIYGGGEVPTFNDCTFRNVKINLQGEASQTAGYLNSLYSNGLPNEVEQVMADVQTGARMPLENPEPPPASYTGDHHQRVLAFAGIIAVVVVWFYAIYVFGWIFQPYATLEDGEPLRTQVDFALIPVLPEDLALEYDNFRLEQINQLDGGSVTDDGATTISIDAAKARALELGFAVREDTESE